MSIVVDKARKQFGDFVALDDVSIEVRDGSLTALLGPSGSGKSTLLRVIAGLELPDSGRVADLGRRHDEGRGPGPRRRLLLPALRRLQAHDRPGQRRLRPLDPQAAEDRDRRSCQRAAQARPARGIQPPLPLTALRRPAPAHGARQGARGRAEGAAARRAVRRPRRARAHRAPPVAAPPPRRGPRDDDLRHPRPGGGDGRRRADRRHERGPRRAGGHARPTSTTTRRPSS